LNRLDGGTANANNQYLQSLADAGVVGLLAAGCLVFAAARLLWRTARQNPGFVGTFYFAAFLWLLAQVIGNQAAVWLAPSCYVGRFLWVTCGLALAIERLPAESPAMEPVGELVTSS
jgi:O-antigen ligase